MSEYIIIGVFALVGVFFAGAAMVVSRLLAPRMPDRGRKLDAYESGEEPIGTARIQFKLGYYLFALVFLVFDVEAIFLFPVLGTLKSARLPPLFLWGEVFAFIFVLACALYYAWKKKVLEWE